MQHVVSRTSNKLYGIMAILIMLGALPIILSLEGYPLWASILLWCIGLGLIFAVKTTEVTPDKITVKYLTRSKPWTVNKEDIVQIESKINAETIAQNVGIMKKDKALQLRIKGTKRMIVFNERFDDSFDQVDQFLRKHYSALFSPAQ